MPCKAYNYAYSVIYKVKCNFCSYSIKPELSSLRNYLIMITKNIEFLRNMKIILPLKKVVRKRRALLKNMREKNQDYKYHAFYKRSALEALRNIEKEKGKLPKAILNQCDNYAKSYLGDIKYAPWLYVYSAIQGEFKHGWIPENYYYKVIVKGSNNGFSAPADLKPLSNRILKTDKLPDLLYVNNGIFIEPLSFKIIPASEARDFLFSEDNTVIFKSNNSIQGLGVRFYNEKEWDAEAINGESGVFQKVIKQHDFFNSIFPHPGATVRITTALDNNGKATVRAAYLRLGRSNDSSKHVQSNSAVKVAIDIDSGELFPTGYSADWSSTKSHPDTGVTFEGLVVPAFKNACVEVEKLHSNYPFIQSIGWDVSVNDKEETEIMEWNAENNDIKFSEAMHGPNFIDLLDRARNK